MYGSAGRKAASILRLPDSTLKAAGLLALERKYIPASRMSMSSLGGYTMGRQMRILGRRRVENAPPRNLGDLESHDLAAEVFRPGANAIFMEFRGPKALTEIYAGGGGVKRKIVVLCFEWRSEHSPLAVTGR